MNSTDCNGTHCHELNCKSCYPYTNKDKPTGVWSYETIGRDMDEFGTMVNDAIHLPPPDKALEEKIIKDITEKDTCDIVDDFNNKDYIAWQKDVQKYKTKHQKNNCKCAQTNVPICGDEKNSVYIRDSETPEVKTLRDEINKQLILHNELQLKIQDDDPVNHPPHYTCREMEAIDIIEMIIEVESNPKVAYNMSNVLKYILRFREKGTPIQDLKKAVWYLNRMIKNIGEEASPD